MRDALTTATHAARPVLHLSGAKLRAALAALIKAAESVGGIERLVEAARLRAEVIAERMRDGRAAPLERTSFEEIVRFMPTVRRRIGPLIDRQGWSYVRAAMADLLGDAHVPGSADSRIAAFESALRASERLRGPHAPTPGMLSMHVSDIPLLDPQINGGGTGRETLPGGCEPGPAREGTSRAAFDRFIRDLAAELLHATYPEHYPLMTRWMWDAQANTGVLREIWHDAASGSDDVDHIVIDVPDSHDTFLVLREELSLFLSDNGIFRDMLWYVDVLAAQIYGDYINAQGGAYLKTDFNSGAVDPLEHTRRILGLDVRKGARL